ncbi:MAG: hypothetical protein A2X94_06210 [Bdellovibrionales bacterium GWB1_55_8]|nr:MAG: hypothetical protein A2X94_06210 [Bdellovibrionales bacterium GWB1_55_8]
MSVSAFIAVGAAVFLTTRSPLFVIQAVELAEQPDEAPVDAQTILRLAAVPTGKISLFELDLFEVERRILANPWVEEVYLQKRFPQTLSIAVRYREPVALIQTKKQGLRYVDVRGGVFGAVTLMYQPDLPLLSHFDSAEQRIPEAIQLIRDWQNSPVGKDAEIASIVWDGEKGFRALTSYLLRGGKHRVMVDLGMESGLVLKSNLEHLARVLRYLSHRGIAARQVWADAGKKIVVKTARGS